MRQKAGLKGVSPSVHLVCASGRRPGTVMAISEKSAIERLLLRIAEAHDRIRPITHFEEPVCSWRRPRSRTRHCQVSGQSACVHRLRRAGKRGEDHGCDALPSDNAQGANVSRLWRLALPAVCAATFVNETGLTRNRDAPNRAISAKNCSIHVDFLLSKILLNIVALP